MRSARLREPPGEIEASDVDELILEPASGWEGSRGVRSTYGRLYRSSGDHRLGKASQGDKDVLLGRSGTSGYRGGRPFFGANDDPDKALDDLLDAMDGDEDLDDDDLPNFGAEAELKLGPLEYKGPQLGGVALGLAAVVLLWKMAG